MASAVRALFLVLLVLGAAPSAVLGETLLAEGGGFRITETSHDVPKNPRDDAARNRGPYDRGTTYGQNELFHPVRKADGTEGVMWQQYGNNLVGKPIFITWFSADGETSETVRVTEDTHNSWLAGATSDKYGNIIYLEIQDVTRWASNELMTGWTIGPGETCKAWMREWDTLRNKQSNWEELNSQAMRLNDFTENTAALRYDPSNNNVGVYLSHRMTRSMDGVNHQRGLGFVFDLDTWRVTGAGHYQTGSHSFQNSLVVDPTGGFIGLELDDGYPRGLQVIKMEANNKHLGFTPYMFKTRHGSGPQNPATGVSYPAYPEISTDGNSFYKWSNDNQVYTVLAQPGIVEVSDGYLIFFSGERPALDSSAMVANDEHTVQFPRNLGWVKIGKNIASKQVLSSGPTETGGFYGFTGEWSAQSHRGINWLTNYEQKWLIMNKPKSVRLAPNRILLMWEQWLSRPMTVEDCREIAVDVNFCIGVVTADWYDKSSDWRETIIRTEFMIIDDEVNVVKPLWAMEGGLVTPQGDAPIVIDGCAIIYVGRGNAIKRWKICEVDCMGDFDIPAAAPTDDPCFEPFPETAGASQEQLALTDFLKTCEVGSVTHGVHDHRVPASERSITIRRPVYEGACPNGEATTGTTGGSSDTGNGSADVAFVNGVVAMYSPSYLALGVLAVTMATLG